MKIYIQTSFEESFETLLLNTDLQSRKIGYEPFIKTQLLNFRGDSLLVKRPESTTEKVVDNVILTLELLYQLPISFERSQWVEYDIKKYIYELYESNITEKTERNLNFLFYTSLKSDSEVNKISDFAKKTKGLLDVSIEVVSIPCMDLHDCYDSKLILENLEKLANLKMSGFISDVYFIDSFDEERVPKLWNIDKISNICADFIISRCTIPTDLDKEVSNTISTIGIQRFELDRFSIIDNWAFHIFKNLCDKVLNQEGEKDNLDTNKVNTIFNEILEDEKESFKILHTLADDEVQSYLEKWKDDFQKKIIDKIVSSDLNNEERQLLLSYFEKITNRDLLELEDFDIKKFDLFDDIYIPYIDQTLGTDNPFVRIKEIIRQIQEIKNRIKERQKNIKEKREVIDKNYHRDGKWINEGYQIGDVIYKIHHSDMLDKKNLDQGELFSLYEPRHSTLLPKSADLKQYFPAIKNQGSQGSCSSFSLTSVFEYFLNNEAHKKDDMSEAFVYYNARELQGNTEIDEGANLHNVIKGMAAKGVCVEELCPYDPTTFNKKPSDEAYEDGKGHIVTSAKDVPVMVETVKAAINEGYPVVGCFRIFESLQENTSGYIPIPTEEERKQEQESFHAMVICGYNDKHCHFIVRNSWGTSFGDNGYCYLPYSYLRDTDLTRYAVAITGIDSKEVFGHKPTEENYDYDQKDKNIQYAILLNLLKEEEHKLDEDRVQLKELVSELKKIIEDLENRNDLIILQNQTDNQLDELTKEIKDIDERKESISKNSLKYTHIIHIALIFVVSSITGYGIFKDNQKIWIPSLVIGILLLLSWILWTLKSKKKQKKLEHKIEELEEKKENLRQTIKDKNALRDRVIMILKTIGEIDNSAHLNKDLLNAIIGTLNECYNQITDNLKDLPNDVDGKDLLYPDWFKKISSHIEEIDLLKKLLVEQKDGDYKAVLNKIQEKILKVLDDHFNFDVGGLYNNGNSPEWNEFVYRIIDDRVYAKFKDTIAPTQIKECSWFLSDLYMPNVQVNCNYVSLNKNRYIYMHIKETGLDCFDF